MLTCFPCTFMAGGVLYHLDVGVPSGFRTTLGSAIKCETMACTYE